MLRVKRYPKKSPYWIIRGTVAGEYVHETSHTTDKRKAEEIANKLAAQILDEKRLGIHPPVTFADAARKAAEIEHGYHQNHGSNRAFGVHS